MGYDVYKKKIMPLCPAAVRQHQVEVHAPGHVHWGAVACEDCGAKFDIGPNIIFGSRLTDVQAAKQFGGDPGRRPQSQSPARGRVRNQGLEVHLVLACRGGRPFLAPSAMGG